MSKRTGETIKKFLYILLPVSGIIFLLWYVKAAGADVIYSDYIRITAEYLDDVRDLSKLLVPDVLTRIPAMYLARFINVSSFGYSVNFDRVLGIAGIGIMAFVIAAYSYKYEIAFRWQAAFYIVLFSLIKWEILLNGTAWAHLVSIGLFFVNYFIADRLWRGESGPREDLFMLLMPLLLLLISGEYIASYGLTMAIMSIMGVLMGGVNSWAAKRGQSIYKWIFAATVLAVGIYMVSRHFAVWDWDSYDVADFGLLEAFMEYPALVPVFFLKSFAGAVIGQETIAAFFGSGAALPDTVVVIIGAALFLSYVLAFMVYIRNEMFEVTIFPVMLLISGFINHCLITISRWMFLNTDYALSSRYAGQFMVGLLGMLLIFSMYERQTRALRRYSSFKRGLIKALTICSVVLIISGNCYTTYQEIVKARYREENYTAMYEAVANYETYTPEELAGILEWHRDTETMYRALAILKENRLNVFGKLPADIG